MPTGRFAPSPTGRLHLGNLRTALVAWLFARSDSDPARRTFRLRFEDLDTQAVRAEHYRTQLDDLTALGLDWDEPVVRQSDRLDLYRHHLDRLLADDVAYPCFCSRREIREAASAPNSPTVGHHYPGTCAQLSMAERTRRAADRPAAHRIRADARSIAFTDRLAGAQTFTLDDFVICRNDGTPAYHLVVVIDDADQGIELVVRGDDLLESAARQLLLYELLGFDPPEHAHVPLVLAPTGERLAKRHGAVNLDDRAALGESAADVLTFLAASLGLTEPGETLTSPVQLIDRFDPDSAARRLPSEPLRLDEHDLRSEPAD